MGLLDLIMPGNPFSGWLDQNRGKVTGAFGGLVGAGNDPRQALMGFTGGLQHGVSVDQENAIIRQKQQEQQAAVEQEKQRQAQITAYLKAHAPQFASLPPDEGLKMAQSSVTGGGDPASLQEYKFYANQELLAGRQPKSFEDWRIGSNQTIKAGLGQPILLRSKANPNEVRAFMPMSDGTYMDPLTQKPADDSWTFDPAYLAALKAQGGQYGGDVAKAQFDAPSEKLNVEQTVAAINDIRNEKAGMAEQFGVFGFNNTPLGNIGIPQQMTPATPGSPKARFQVAVDRGVNRAFMGAREMLRGGGSITDFESRKAESAITNMQLAMEKGDQAQFLKALDDFEQAVKDGYQKLLTQAGGLPPISPGPRVQSPNSSSPPAASGGVIDYRTILGIGQ